MQSDWRAKRAPGRAKKKKVAVGFYFDMNHLFLIDHYCEEFRKDRTAFITDALYEYMIKKGMLSYEPPEFRSDNRLDKIIGEYHDEREIDAGSWVTDPGDFGFTDDNTNAAPSSTDEGT